MQFPPLGELTVWNTSRCNFRCKYCFVFKLYEDIPRQEMQRETMNALLHFARHNLRRDGMIWFFGGEPLVSFDTMKYITEKAVADNLAIRFGVTTNCYLLNKDILKWMKKYGYGILCSIDGLQKTHDKYRVLPDGRGTWKVVWENIKKVKKILNPNPQLRWTFSPETIDGLTEGLKFFVKHGFTNVAIDAVYEVEWDEDSLNQLREELTKMRDFLDRCYERNIPVFSMFVRDAATAVMNNRRINWIQRCGLGQGGVGVAPDGKIYPCHRFVSSRKLVIGSVFDGFYPERIYLNEEWQKVPPYCEVPERCLSCKFKNACMGGCLAVNYDLFGDIHIVPKAMCDIKNIVVEVFKPLVVKHKDNPTFRRIFKVQVRE